MTNNFFAKYEIEKKKKIQKNQRNIFLVRTSQFWILIIKNPQNTKTEWKYNDTYTNSF